MKELEEAKSALNIKITSEVSSIKDQMIQKIAEEIEKLQNKMI